MTIGEVPNVFRKTSGATLHRSCSTPSSRCHQVSPGDPPEESPSQRISAAPDPPFAGRPRRPSRCPPWAPPCGGGSSDPKGVRWCDPQIPPKKSEDSKILWDYTLLYHIYLGLKMLWSMVMHQKNGMISWRSPCAEFESRFAVGLKLGSQEAGWPFC